MRSQKNKKLKGYYSIEFVSLPFHKKIMYLSYCHQIFWQISNFEFVQGLFNKD